MQDNQYGGIHLAAVMFFDYGEHGFFVFTGAVQNAGNEANECPSTWIK